MNAPARSRHLLGPLLLVALTCALPLAGCDRDGDDQQGAGSPSADLGPAPAEAGAEATRDRGDAFGLPLPPQSVLGVRRSERRISVNTRMTLPMLERFFRRNFIDYEIIRVGNVVRAVPLREHMPRVRASRPRGASHPRQVVYTLPYTPEELATGRPEVIPVEERRARSGQDPRRRAQERSEPSRRPGAPVTLKTRDGRPLAPGARWGEPYTPPPGTPLHTAENRQNFGLPFGKWQLN